MNRTLRLFSLSLFALALLGVLGCEPEVLKIGVLGDDAITFNTLGESQAVSIVAYDRDAKEVKDPKVKWYSINPAIADVSATGLIQPKADGKTKVVVRSGYAQKEVVVDVHLFAKVVPAKTSVTVPVGGFETLTAQVLDRRGAEVEDATISWTSTNPSVVEVGKDGTLVGVAKGEAAIVADAKGLTAEVKVQVVPGAEAPSM